MNRLNVMKPWMGEEEIRAVSEVIESGWVAQGPRVADFEAAFATEMEIEHAVATSNCTTALHLALVVAGIGADDEVIVPSFSFIATANAPTYVGAKPIFADVDAQTGNVTAATVQASLSDRTRAVIAVDQGGLPVDLASIRALCDPLGIIVIEDSACGAGSTYLNRPVGARAELTAWSFHPRKVLTTGEGGMLTTAREDWAVRARRLREHGMSVSAKDRQASVLSPPEEYLEIGFNFRMTDLQAAIGIVQLSRLPAMVQRRRELASRYIDLLHQVPGLRAVEDPAWGKSNFQSFWVEVNDSSETDRDGMLRVLAEAGVSARRGIMAAHRQPPYRGGASLVSPLPVTEHLTDTTLILPIFHEMTTAQQDLVVDVLATAATRRGAA